MIFSFWPVSQRAPFKEDIFPATVEELQTIRDFYSAQQRSGASPATIIAELLDDGWTKDEVAQAIPSEYQAFRRHYVRGIIFYFCALVVLFVASAVASLRFGSYTLQYIFALPFVLIVFAMSRLFLDANPSGIVERRIILFFNRFNAQFPLDDLSQSGTNDEGIAARNPTKLFLPTKDKEHFRIFGGSGTYQGRDFHIYVAKKYSHTEGSGDQSRLIYRYFIFYEFMMRPVPFYFSVVRENVFEAQSHRLQNKNLQTKDFQDMDFAAREFNENWRLRGTDKKLAYQVFDPQMMSLVMRVKKSDLIGLEMSDRSVILSNRFNTPAIDRCAGDMKLVYEIATQVERNYREVKW